MGDRSPSEFLDHAMSLLPDPKVFFEVVLLDALPPNARVAALQHSDVHDMARAADAVWLENKAAAEMDRASASVASLSLACDDDAAAAHLVATPPRARCRGRLQGPSSQEELTLLCARKIWQGRL